MKKIKYVLFSLSLFIFILGSILLGLYYHNGQKASDKLVELAKTKTLVIPSAQSLILPELKPLYDLNSDMVGWLKINGTAIDYPVMQKDKEYYLTRDFDKEKSAQGLPFADQRCNLENQEQNVVVYAHNIKSGAMFHDLLQYQDEAFRDANQLISFDTLYERRTYLVQEVVSYIDKDMGSYATGDDGLLVLVTCSYHTENGRFAVIAKRAD